jgi:hypothetical protein
MLELWQFLHYLVAARFFSGSEVVLKRIHKTTSSKDTASQRIRANIGGERVQQHVELTR